MSKGLDIPVKDWTEASGSYVQDECGRLWRIIGFIDRPAVILEPVKLAPRPGDADDARCRQTVIMGSPIAAEYHRLVREGDA